MTSPTEIAELATGSVLVAIGALAVAAAALGLPRRDPAAFWFGVFSALYGLRLLADSDLLRGLTQPPSSAWNYLDAAITYVIVTPALLFAGALVGAARRRWLRLAVLLLALYAAVAFAVDALRSAPRSMLWLNPYAVTLFVTALALLFLPWARRGRWSRGVRVAFAGGVVFTALAIYETFRGSPLEDAWDLEPFGLLVFVCALGYVVAEQAVARERRLVAVSRELSLAREIQQSLLPRTLPQTAGLRVAARYVPVSDVAGDFYDVVSSSTRTGSSRRPIGPTPSSATTGSSASSPRPPASRQTSWPIGSSTKYASGRTAPCRTTSRSWWCGWSEERAGSREVGHRARRTYAGDSLTSARGGRYDWRSRPLPQRAPSNRPIALP